MDRRRTPSGQGPARSAPRPGGGRSRAHAHAHAAGPRHSATRRPGAASWRPRTRKPPRRITGRAATLGLLLVALVLAYAYPVRVYLAQEAEIDRMRAAQEAQRRHIQDLTVQLDLWNDEEYVIAQARRRLHYVRRGELVYVVGDDPGPPAPADGPGNDRTSWYSQLWTNVQGVDSPPRS